MATENVLWSWLKPGLPDSHHASRIENLVGKSMPDIEICANGVQVWIEAKVLKSMVKNGQRGTLVFQPGQREWARDRWKAGGLSYVLIGAPVPGASQNIGEVFLIPGGWVMSLPQGGAVRLSELRDMSVLHAFAKGHTTAVLPKKDRATLNQLVHLLFRSNFTRTAFDMISAARPEFLTENLSPADDFLLSLLRDADNL